MKVYFWRRSRGFFRVRVRDGSVEYPLALHCTSSDRWAPRDKDATLRGPLACAILRDVLAVEPPPWLHEAFELAAIRKWPPWRGWFLTEASVNTWLDAHVPFSVVIEHRWPFESYGDPNGLASRLFTAGDHAALIRNVWEAIIDGELVLDLDLRISAARGVTRGDLGFDEPVGRSPKTRRSDGQYLFEP
jgi:hypothetical protein